MRVIVRKERPHPRAQLRFTDIDGHLFTALAADAKKGQLADLELRRWEPKRLRLRLFSVAGRRKINPSRTPQTSRSWVRKLLLPYPRDRSLYPDRELRSEQRVRGLSKRATEILDCPAGRN